MFLIVQSKFEPRRACHYLDFYDRIQFRASQNVKPVTFPRLATLITIGLYRLTYITRTAFHGAKVPDSAMLPGEIPYFPHPCVASALLRLKYAKQFSGREDSQGKRPFFGRFHHIALSPNSWINSDSFNATSAARADRDSRQKKPSHSSQTLSHAR
jgi:hypothetical protein